MMIWRGSMAGVARRPTLGLAPTTCRTWILPPKLSRGGVVSLSAKKPRRRGRPTPEVDDEDDSAVEVTGMGGVGFPAFTSLRADRPPPNHTKAPTKELEDSKLNGSSSLRGLDVLQALQKAAVRKKGTNSARKGGGKVKPGGGTRRGESGEEPPLTDYGSVRPLQIKDDWGARLDEMERRIQELLTQHHH